MVGLTLDHGVRVNDAVDLEGNSQGSVAFTASANESAALAEGIYDVWTDQDCYTKVGPTANDVTTSTGYLHYAGNTIPYVVRANSKIGAIGAGAGTLRYHRTA